MLYHLAEWRMDFVFFLTAAAALEIYTLSLHDALPICGQCDPLAGDGIHPGKAFRPAPLRFLDPRSEEHTSELLSLRHLVCRLLLEKKKKRRTLDRSRWSTQRAFTCPLRRCCGRPTSPP